MWAAAGISALEDLAEAGLAGGVDEAAAERSSKTAAEPPHTDPGAPQPALSDPGWRGLAGNSAESMAIPEVDERGFLPQGVHDASLDEVLDRFGRFRESDRRETLGRQLAAFIEEARGTGLVACLILDGSFTTSKTQPGDIDLVVVLRRGVDLLTDFRPDQYNVVSARRVRGRYPFDVFHALEGSDGLAGVVEFFSRVTGEPGLSKGMVRVAI